MIRDGCLHAGPRQREILALLAGGQSDRQIALSLGISVTTVRTYLVRLYRDNGFRNRTEAAAVWIHSTLSSKDDVAAMNLRIGLPTQSTPD